MKKNIAKLLVFAMLLSMLPFTVAADGEANPTAATTQIENAYVTVSDVKVGETQLTCAAPGTDPYVFSTDTLVAPGEVEVSFKVVAKTNETVYKVAGDTELTRATDGTVTEKVTVSAEDTPKTLNYTIDAGGTSSNPGKTKISITFKVGTSETTPKVTKIELSNTSLSLVKGGTGELSATVTVEPETADVEVTWESGDEKIATVAESEEDPTTVIVTAVEVGETVITAKAGDSTATCKVTVEAVAENVDHIADPLPVVDKAEPTDETEKAIVDAAAEAVEAATAPELSSVANEAIKVTEEEVADAKQAMIVKELATAEDTLVAVLVPKLKIKVTGGEGTSADSITSLSFEITAFAEVRVAKEADKDGTLNDDNSVPVGEEVSLANTDKPITIELPVPAAFTVSSPVVKHVKSSGRTYWHKAEIIGEGESKRIRFCNNRGFSAFTLQSGDDLVAEYKDEMYESLQDAIDAVDDKGEITVLKSNAEATVSKEVTFTLKYAEGVTEAKITAGSGYEVSKSGNTYTVTKKSSGGGSGGGGGGSSKPAIKPGEKPTTPGTTAPSGGVAGFTDVATSAWYADAVQYVVDKGLFGGVGNGNFAPNANMTRAMMWTVLARYKGVNTNTGSNWYEAARTWAIAQGISDGTMADGNVTREQFVTMLWRLSGEPTVTNSATFTDAGKVSDYAKAAVDWAVSKGIVNGYNDGSFKPQGSATRAEVAKMLTVFCEDDEQTTTTETTTDTTTTDTTTDTPKDANGASLGEG